MWAAIVGVVASIIGIVALVYQIVLTRRALARTDDALKVAREANAIAKANAYEDRRPWLRVAGVEIIGAAYGGSESVFCFRFNLRNYGKTAALGGTLRCRTFPHGRPDLYEFLKGDSGIRSPRLSIGDFAPDESRSEELAFSINTEDVLCEPKGFIELPIAISYRSAERDKDHVLIEHWQLKTRTEWQNLEEFEPADFIHRRVDLVAVRHETTLIS